MTPNNFRLYTFVAGLYLSELQKGLQTAHVVGNIAAAMDNLELASHDSLITSQAFADWAREDKTIIICNAGNHKGVLDCWAEIKRINSALGLPAAIFYEDEQSMNGMATACGVIVPREYYEVTFVPGDPCAEGEGNLHDSYEHVDTRGYVRRMPVTHPEGQFIRHIKQYRLA